MVKQSGHWLDNLVYRNAWAVVIGVGTLIFWGSYMFIEVTTIAHQQDQILSQISTITDKYNQLNLVVKVLQTKAGIN